jgi:diguanylate cyclase (GGDEF)-like protein/PAS domain S-box-containing protein
VCVIDAQRKIVLWSVGAERLTGHLRHEVIGHVCAAEPLLHCDQPGCEFCSDNCSVARAIKTAQPTEALGFLRHKAGHEIPVHIRSVPVHNEHGSIIGAVETFEDMQQAESPDHREDSLKLPGCIDDVTGVASHVLMQSHLRQCLATFVEVEVPFGVMCLRLEGLQNFRASLGPEAAAALLRVVARSVRGTLWVTDLVGRWGDDQFLAIVNGCREEALHTVRERVSRMLANDGIEWWGERRSLPVSIGQATVQPGDTVEALLERARKSLDTASAWGSASAANAGGTPSSGS